MGRRSINQQIKRANSSDKMRELSIRWTREWQTDHDNIIRDLEQAIQTDDYDLLCKATGSMKEANRKRFEALNNMLHNIADYAEELERKESK